MPPSTIIINWGGVALTQHNIVTMLKTHKSAYSKRTHPYNVYIFICHAINSNTKLLKQNYVAARFRTTLVLKEMDFCVFVVVTVMCMSVQDGG